MLHHLKISNLATIEQVEIEFKKGFSILTGETGAGKSIIIDAIQLVLGAKADAALIRSGKPNATVEAVFDISQQDFLKTFLEGAGLLVEDELIIRRIIPREGRQKIWLNDSNITHSRLSEIGRQLIDIHGQHDNQALLQVSSHITFLDGFGQLTPLKEGVQTIYAEYEATLDEQKQLRKRLQERSERMEVLHYQQEELEKANLQEGEDEELQQEAQILTHAEKLTLLLSQVTSQLYEGEGAIIEQLGSVQRTLREAEKLDPRCGGVNEMMNSCSVQLDDIYRFVSEHSSKIEENPQRLDWVNERLNQIQRLERKYKVDSLTSLLSKLELIRQELKSLQSLDIDEQELAEKTTKLKQSLHDRSLVLSKKRSQIASKLSQEILNEMHELGMEKSEFQTLVSQHRSGDGEFRYSSTGIDHVEFLLSVNPGQEPLSLVKVASGGELSRIMLALKTVLTTIDTVETLIFDEVDSGISGRIAEIVGQKLHSLGKRHQVLCITHLPQVAAFSENHLVVSKNVKNGETYTSIRYLEEKGKNEELARLMGGQEITKKTLELAKEMRNSVKKR